MMNLANKKSTHNRVLFLYFKCMFLPTKPILVNTIFSTYYPTINKENQKDKKRYKEGEELVTFFI